MNDDELLFAACLANPAEDTLRLALADWYDEHDESERAAELRAGRDVVAFLAELCDWRVSPNRRVQIYENGALRDLFAARVAARLLTRYRGLFPVPPGARTEYQEDAPPPKTYKDPLNPAAFLSQWQYERRKQVAAIRELAARRAQHQREPHTFPPAPDAKEFEEQSCLLQELVLRGRDASAYPGAHEHHARMRERGHPLAWLPLHTFAPESEFAGRLPQFGGRATVPVLGTVSGPASPVVPSALPTVTEVVSVSFEAPLFAAVRTWIEESNGSLEGKVFRLDRPLAGTAPTWLANLPADSLSGATVTAAPLAGAFAELFSAAQSGGAYGGSRWGAYGRLNAWQSLGALCGCSRSADADEIATAAARCEWFTFNGPWFDHLGGDLGVMCVRPDRMSVALLAASDAD